MTTLGGNNACILRCHSCQFFKILEHGAGRISHRDVTDTRSSQHLHPQSTALLCCRDVPIRSLLHYFAASCTLMCFVFVIAQRVAIFAQGLDSEMCRLGLCPPWRAKRPRDFQPFPAKVHRTEIASPSDSDRYPTKYPPSPNRTFTNLTSSRRGHPAAGDSHPPAAVEHQAIGCWGVSPGGQPPGCWGLPVPFLGVPWGHSLGTTTLASSEQLRGRQLRGQPPAVVFGQLFLGPPRFLQRALSGDNHQRHPPNCPLRSIWGG